jgi:hypothetical protein
MRWVDDVARVARTNACTVLAMKCEGKRLFGRLMRSWNDNITTDHETEYVVGWIHLAQGTAKWRAFVATAMNLQFAQNRRLEEESVAY